MSSSRYTSAATTARLTSHRSESDHHHATPAVIAEGIGVTGDQGPVFGPLDFTIPGEGLTVLAGRGGSGRTALALTISGRMRPNNGTLEVLGDTNPRAFRRHVAIAGVEEIDQLDRDVKLSTVFTEHLAWTRPWFSLRKKADEDYYRRLCEPVFGDRTLPPLDAYVSQISGLDRILIRISLALAPAGGDEIRMLVMDDIEQVHEIDDRLVLIGILARLSETMPVVVNAVNELPKEIMPHYTLIELFTDAGHLQPENAGGISDLVDTIRSDMHSIHTPRNTRTAEENQQ
ncbi:hypothetical protein [Corynebacterium aquilae]|uniref:hypothetical protein n=1 Tax=Corynebacterium aquilae TaxID=203263 RepID=UPI00095127E6|nr:hypothetical protein [Corynebacterium aquilae]